MKKCIKVLSVTLLAAAVLGMASCTKGPKNALVGTWSGIDGENSTITFTNEGTCQDVSANTKIEGTYRIDEDKKTVIVYDGETETGFRYFYDVSEDNLTLQMEYGLPRSFERGQ